MRRLFTTVFLMFSLVTTACGAGPPGYLTNPHFHSVALDPEQHPFSHPGYLIGIEKAVFDKVGRVPFGTCPPDAALCLNREAEYLADKKEWRKTLDRRLDDPKRLFVSHIAAYEQANGQGHTLPLQARLLANLYRNDSLTCAKGPNHPEPTCIREGVEALKSLKADLEQRIARERPTHVLFYSTGWNSDQNDSIRRYNLFFDQIVKAAHEAGDNSFRPIFIGISWPADWPELPGPLDILNKKDDADEVAATWINYLVNQVLLPLKKNDVKIVLIGHSFGGRIVATATNSRDLLPNPVQDKVNLVVGLQAAFSIKRFAGGTEGAPFKDFSAYADKFVFISSTHDDCGKQLGPFVYALNPILGEEGIKEAKKGDLATLFEVFEVTDSGEWEGAPSRSPEKALLLDASSIVKDRKGPPHIIAHNDVNNQEVGRLLWKTIKVFAP